MKVKIIRQDGAACLVEYADSGGVHRCIVPSSEIVNGECEIDVLQSGISYGVDWASLIGDFNTDKAIISLHRDGMWNIDDLARDPLAIRRALLAAVEDNIQSVLRQLALKAKEEK